MVKSLLIAGCINPSTSTVNTTEYWNLYGYSDKSTELGAQRRIYEAGVLSHFHIKLKTNSVSTAATSFTVRKNGADTGIIISVPASQIGTFEDVSHTETIASGDFICVKTIPGAATGTFQPYYMYLLFTPTDTNVCLSFLSFSHPSGRTNLTGASTRYYQAINGYFDTANTTQASAQMKFQIAGTLKNMTAYVFSNSRTTNTVAEIRKGGVSQSLAVTYGNVETLEKVNTSNTVTVADDDLINFSVLNGTGTSAISWNRLTVEFETTGDPAKHVQIGYSQILANVSRNQTRFYSFAGYFDHVTSEAECQMDWPVDGFTATNLGVYISANSISTASTFALRKNGATSALTISIPGTQIGYFEDVSHSVALAEGDDVCPMLISGTGSGSQNITMRGYMVHLEAPNVVPPTAMDVSDTMVLTNKFITKV